METNQEYTSLEHAGRAVLARFSALPKTSDPVYERKLTNEFQRFESWASNLGLYHTGHSSLDYRFRDSPILFEYTVDLLKDFEGTLITLANVTGEASRSSNDDVAIGGESDDMSVSDDESDEDLSSYQDESAENEYLANLALAIDRLYALSFRVRNPRMRTGLSKAQYYTEIDEQSGVDLIQAYWERDVYHITELFQSWRPNTEIEDDVHFLIQRLATANMHRRQQFKYWEQRRAKYEYYHRAAVAQLVGAKAINDNLPIDYLPIESASQPRLETHIQQSEPSTATNLDAARLRDAESVISTASFFSVDDSTLEPLKIPSAPNIAPDKPEFECPYCFTMCARTTLKPQAWRRHVLRDLRPYICTFPFCKHEDQLYDTFSEWAAHEVSIHGLQVESPRHCPVCLYENADNHHIASHLQRIACFSLPRMSDDNTGSLHTMGRTESHNTGAIDSDTDSEEFVADAEWEENTKTIHLNLAGYHPLQVQVRPSDAIEEVLATRLVETYNLDPSIKFRFSDPNGNAIPLDYDNLYDQMAVNVQDPQAIPVDSADFPAETSNEHPVVVSSLDPRYRVQPHRYFSVGRVFAILWHENKGVQIGADSTRVALSGPTFTGRYNEPIYSTIRRMVVFRVSGHSSFCFPISTYGNRGVAKRGVDPDKHAIIYLRGTQPIQGLNEPRMVKEPLEVVADSPEQTVNPMSRLDFGRIHTVEHNAKVLPIGRVTLESMARFIQYTRDEIGNLV